MDNLRDGSLLVGRVVMAALFVYDGALFTHAPTLTMHFMERAGLPGILFWPTAFGLMVGGLLLAAGVLARLAALWFALFCLLTAVLFHHHLAGTSQAIQFGKDLALAGGFLVLAAVGPGRFSLGRRRGWR